ncbi:hypothetical protein Poly24_35070 [Rosistilla carotiformis]|uniref:Uncharacterized protein n=1 Tax=Rosistilla carotiformis TaxID=2528017 RepID=A0A518JW81_9BACT|nr:hypothetical protein [Rosistilla carotiformis]QDV69790.1 hypothetical protein Poly24_35070 [Rosistilla carotiformis]
MIGSRGIGRNGIPAATAVLLAVAITIALGSLTTNPLLADELLADFPIDGAKGSGIALTVTAGSAQRVGVCPVTVEVRSIGPTFAADRKLTIELRPRSAPPNQNTFDFRQTIDLAESDSIHRVVLEVPIYYPWTQCRVRVLEDGAVLPGHDSQSATPIFLSTDNIPALTLTIIESRTVDSDPPDWQRFPDCRSLWWAARGEMEPAHYLRPKQLDHEDAKLSIRPPGPTPLAIKTVHEDRLPDRWTLYNDTDAVMVSVKTLQRIAEENPTSLLALQQWLSTGGVLWTYGDAGSRSLSALFSMSDAWERLPLSKIQQASQTAPLQSQATTGHSFAPQDLVSTMERVMNNANLQHPFVLVEGARSVQQRITTHRYLAGKIVHIDDPYPFPGSIPQWKTMVTATPAQIGTENRLGFDIVHGDSNFWTWLIAEVGQPPVYTFLGMISLFVLLVGPVSYYVFLYLKRLYLFFVFAPIVALICTAAIGLYAMIADGFGSRVRIRHLTLLNASGAGVNWSRQTYFSGLRPRDGVAWSRDTAVYPLREPQQPGGGATQENEDAGAAQVVIDADAIRLQGTFMPSRTQSQFVAITPQMDGGAIVARRGKGIVRVENRTEHPIQSILLADASKRIWVAEAIEARGAADAVAMLPVDAARWMTTNYLDNAPELPAGYQDASQSELLRLGNRRRLRNSRGPRIFNTSSVGGLVEAMFRNTMVEQGAPPANHFVALADVPAEAIGIDGAKPVECIHMMMGEVRFVGEPDSDGDRDEAAGEVAPVTNDETAESDE